MEELRWYWNPFDKCYSTEYHDENNCILTLKVSQDEDSEWEMTFHHHGPGPHKNNFLENYYFNNTKIFFSFPDDIFNIVSMIRREAA